ncbi:hypothetical protein GWI33_018785 [Rhynchophorus ferrugineus]|uniref:Uncharacterized protein n=1 Tax=Rhynchophorus ferrugineus TaxID=354439 RepID=A0A834HW84_RHYFE|nr:hypothetical protein GWI33_018785 [Rhynchophorus ferrugineus]
MSTEDGERSGHPKDVVTDENIEKIHKMILKLEGPPFVNHLGTGPVCKLQITSRPRLINDSLMIATLTKKTDPSRKQKSESPPDDDNAKGIERDRSVIYGSRDQMALG